MVLVSLILSLKKRDTWKQTLQTDNYIHLLNSMKQPPKLNNVKVWLNAFRSNDQKMHVHLLSTVYSVDRWCKCEGDAFAFPVSLLCLDHVNDRTLNI